MSASLAHLFDALLEFNQKFWHGPGDTSCRASWVELPPDFTLLLRQSITCHAIFTCAVRIVPSIFFYSVTKAFFRYDLTSRHKILHKNHTVFFCDRTGLSSLKSDIVHTLLSFLGVINVGDVHCHCNEGCHSNNTPMLHSRLISFMRMALCLCRIGYGLPWYGFIPSFISEDTCSRFQSTSMPLNSDSYFE